METLTQVKERPIIMSAESVRAIREGRKTQTRRVIKAFDGNLNYVRRIISPYDCDIRNHRKDTRWLFEGRTRKELNGWDRMTRVRCPYKPGDRLWVKETWCHERLAPGSKISNIHPSTHHSSYLHYKADHIKEIPGFKGWWRSPLFMPRWAARLWLEITEARAERLQDISEEDCYAEGFPLTMTMDPVTRIMAQRFAQHWNAINAKRGHPWKRNDWVWVITFKEITP